MAKGFRVLLVYTDSMELVCMSSGRSAVPISVWWGIQELRQVMTLFGSIQILKVPRRLVHPAHALAVRARRRELLCYSFDR